MTSEESRYLQENYDFANSKLPPLPTRASTGHAQGVVISILGVYKAGIEIPTKILEEPTGFGPLLIKDFIRYYDRVGPKLRIWIHWIDADSLVKVISGYITGLCGTGELVLMMLEAEMDEFCSRFEEENNLLQEKFDKMAQSMLKKPSGQ